MGELVNMTPPAREVTDEDEPLKCIVCGFQPEAAVPGPVNQPYAATTFHTNGHYGSTVFDPMSPGGLHTLEINVCDKCLKRKAKEGLILYRVETPARPILRYEEWDPDVH